MSAHPHGSLRELPRTARRDGNRLRRWFGCANADLYLWYEEDAPVAFELCFGKPNAEHSVRWDRAHGLSWSRIDDGEGNPLRNRTPIAVANGAGDLPGALAALERHGAGLDAEIRQLVETRLRSESQR